MKLNCKKCENLLAESFSSVLQLSTINEVSLTGNDYMIRVDCPKCKTTNFIEKSGQEYNITAKDETKIEETPNTTDNKDNTASGTPNTEAVADSNNLNKENENVETKENTGTENTNPKGTGTEEPKPSDNAGNGTTEPDTTNANDGGNPSDKSVSTDADKDKDARAYTRFK